MKKIVSLALSLVMCLMALPALAETIEVEEMLLDNGLCFVAPAEWTYMELDADDYEEGYVMMAMEESTGRCMAVMVEEGEAGVTCADLAEVLAEDAEFAGAKTVTNEHGAELVLYAYADQTMICYCILDEAGMMYNFSFLNVEDEVISGDDALLELVDTCMAATYFDEDLVTDDEDMEAEDTQITANGSIALTMVNLEDGPVFPIPADWSEIKLDDSDIEDGCVAAFMDQEIGRNMLIMANEIGAISTADLAEVLAEDSDYANVQLMTNGYGQELILVVTADLSAGGYCLMDDDGWMYSFLFGLADGSVMTDDQVLAQLVQDCMANTYFEE